MMETLKQFNGFLRVKCVCRLCLALIDDDDFISIFLNSHCTDMKATIEECLSLNVSIDDGLPPNICTMCASKLKDWCEFKENAQRSDMNLREVLSSQAQVTTKYESEKDEDSDDFGRLYIKQEGDVEINDDDDDDDVPLSEMLQFPKDEKEDKPKRCRARGRPKSRAPRVKPFCANCNLKFTSFEEFNSHQQDVHGIVTSEEAIGGVDAEAFDMYRCHICKADFQNRDTLRDHCKSLHNVKVIHPYGCSHCDRQFPSWGLLVVHERQHTGEKPYSCDICGKQSFISHASLRRHKLMHLKFFSCTQCGRNFNCDSALKAHVRCKHTDEKPFLCNVCGRSFSLATILTAHMTSHSTERKYRCDICGFASKTSGNHHRHKARHKQGGAKSFHCDTCGKAFETKLKLSSHQIIHRPVRPHVCKLCGKGFLYNNKLERHILLVHARERPYPCHLCGRKLASKFGLGIHLKTHFKTEQQPLPSPEPEQDPMQEQMFIP